MSQDSLPMQQHAILLLHRGFPERPDAVALAGEHGEILAVNDTFVAITGRAREELVGRSVFDLDLRVQLEPDSSATPLITMDPTPPPSEVTWLTRTGRIGFAGSWLNVVDPDVESSHLRTAEAERRVETERIRGILDGDGLSMVYQPIVDLRSGRIAGLEALSRFVVEPRRRPDVWFAEARVLGLGLELQLAAAAKAVERLWEIPADLFLSVNVSGDVVASHELQELLEEVDAKRIVIEITEHDAIEDYEDTLEAVDRLREMGVRLAVDDVGAGFASLRHLLRLNPDLLKLDTSLCRHLHTDPGRALAEGLLSFATASGAAVVAEGIETAEELAGARSLHVDLGQGFHLAMPEPLHCVLHEVEEIEARLAAAA